MAVPAVAFVAAALAVPSARPLTGPGRLLLLEESRPRPGLAVVDVARGRRVGVISVSEWYVRSPDGARVATPCPRMEEAICVARVDGRARRVVIRHPDGSAHDVDLLGWSPNSRRIVVGTDEGTWEVGAAGGGYRQLSSEAIAPVWSPRGTHLAYEKNGAIHVLRPGADGRRITPAAAMGTGGPLWSPRGSLIAYVQTTRRAVGIHVVRPDGSRRRRVAIMVGRDAVFDWAHVARTLNWSADEGSLAYLSPGGHAFVVDVATGRRTRLGRGEGALFSPLGRSLVWSTDSTRGTGLYRYRLILVRHGRPPLAIADEAIGATPYIDWSADGRRLAYMRRDGLWVVDVTTLRTRRVLRWDLRADHFKGPLEWR